MKSDMGWVLLGLYFHVAEGSLCQFIIIPIYVDTYNWFQFSYFSGGCQLSLLSRKVSCKSWTCVPKRLMVVFFCEKGLNFFQNEDQRICYASAAPPTLASANQHWGQMQDSGSFLFNPSWPTFACFGRCLFPYAPFPTPAVDFFQRGGAAFAPRTGYKDEIHCKVKHLAKLSAPTPRGWDCLSVRKPWWILLSSHHPAGSAVVGWVAFGSSPRLSWIMRLARTVRAQSGGLHHQQYVCIAG